MRVSTYKEVESKQSSTYYFYDSNNICIAEVIDNNIIEHVELTASEIDYIKKIASL